MTASDVGIFLALLSESWMSCGLPDEGPIYAAMAKDLSVSVEQLLGIRSQMFDRDEQTLVWTNARLERERSRAEEVSKLRAAAGKAAHKPKRAKAKQPSAIAEQVSTPNPAQPSPAQPSSTQEKNTPLPPAGEIPEITDPRARQAMADWKAHKKSKFTPIVAEKTRKALDSWGVDRFVAAVDFSIASSYQGLIEPRQQNGALPGMNGKPWDERRAIQRLSSSDPRVVALGEEELRSHGIDPKVHAR